MRPGPTLVLDVDLYVAITGLSVCDASLELCEKTGTEVAWLPWQVQSKDDSEKRVVFQGASQTHQ